MSDFEINNRVKKVQIYSGLNQKDFADKIGVSYTTVNEVLNNKKGPGMNVIQGIAFAFVDVSKEWLLTGKGSLLLDEGRKTIDPFKSAPYYPALKASAGFNFLKENSQTESVPISIPIVDAQLYINVFGDSMYPKYSSGDIIGIKETDKEFVMYGYVYVIQMVDGAIYLKYIKKGKDEQHWILASENPEYEPKEYPLSNISNVFIVKAVISKTSIL